MTKGWFYTFILINAAYKIIPLAFIAVVSSFGDGAA
jgi:hypothetical protein